MGGGHRGSTPQIFPECPLSAPHQSPQCDESCYIRYPASPLKEPENHLRAETL